MKISVALAVYNGTNYLTQQLDSFITQTRFPDELVAVDDASTDDTRLLLEHFASTAPFPVRIISNEVNSGSTHSFDRAIENCTGDLIFLSDHDDVWFPLKLERMAAQFIQDPELGLLQANAEVVDEDLVPFGWLLFEKSFPAEKRAVARREGIFRMMLDRNVVGGATCAFKSEYRKYFLPIPTNLGLMHDGWIGTIISAVARTDFLDEPLMYYRQHRGQQVGTEPKSDGQSASDRKRMMQAAAEDYMKKVERIDATIKTLEDIRRREPANALLENSITIATAEREGAVAATGHFNVRSNLSAGFANRVPAIVSESLSGRYHKFSSGFRSIARDLLDR